MMKKFSEFVEKYESENNGRVIFTVIDNAHDVMCKYEEEEYNRVMRKVSIHTKRIVT